MEKKTFNFSNAFFPAIVNPNEYYPLFRKIMSEQATVKCRIEKQLIKDFIVQHLLSSLFEIAYLLLSKNDQH